MEVDNDFVSVAGLICEPVRARMLWNLLDGRAYTASELAIVGDISPTSASNHLTKLLEADIIKVELQGRHRYYSFSKPEVAYVVESLANLASINFKTSVRKNSIPEGVQYCRTCYDHLAGYVSVRLAEAIERKGYIKKSDGAYAVTERGWKWLVEFDIVKSDFKNNRRPLTRQCLDWSERRPHLAGLLGAFLLEKMIQRKWFKRFQFSRELMVTAKGRQELNAMLGLQLH